MPMLSVDIILYWLLPGSKSLQNKFLLFCGDKKRHITVSAIIEKVKSAFG